MPEPYDYTSAFANLPSAQDAMMAGLKGGLGIKQAQFESQQQQAALLQAQQQKADLAALAQNPTPQAIGALMIKYPGLSEQLKRGADVLGPAQQQAQVDHASQVYAAVLNGQPDIAQKLLTDRAAALRNSGDEKGAATAETIATLVKDHPEFAKQTIGLRLAAAMGPDKFTAAFKDIGAEQRATELHSAAVREADAKAGGAEADLAIKNRGIVAQTAGALAKPGVKPSQAQTMFRTLAARGAIPKDELQGYLDGIPADPKALPDYLRQVQASGLTAAEQTKYTTPDANTVANNATQVQTTGMNNRTSIETTQMNNNTSIETAKIAAQSRKDAREIALTHGVKGLTDEQNEALFGKNGAVTTGRLDPNKVNSRTAALFADAFLKNPDADFAKISSDINSGRKADTEFATGKSGNAIRSFNVGISHLDTLNNLADALNNGDLKAFNQIGNFIATQTGQPAPTNFGAAKKIVGDELVKAIVGAGGTGHDREEVAKTIDAANSPAQLKGAIKTVQELMVGQLGGLEQQYRTTTRRDDFDKYLSPRALEIRKSHGGGGHGAAPAAAASTIPAGWSVREH